MNREPSTVAADKWLEEQRLWVAEQAKRFEDEEREWIKAIATKARRRGIVLGFIAASIGWIVALLFAGWLA